MTVAAHPSVEQLLPRRSPMVLIGRLAEASEQEGTCEVPITPQPMFPKAAGVPTCVGVEYTAQSVATHGGYRRSLDNEPIAVGLLMGTRRSETSCQFSGRRQTLRIHVSRRWGKLGFMRHRCAIASATTGTLFRQAELHVFKPKTVQSYLEGVGHDHSRTHQRG